MLWIQDVLVSEELVKKQFVCNLDACKGACCWEGDYGAPLEEEELKTLENIYPLIRPFLTQEGIQVLEEQGRYTYIEDTKAYGTPLIDNGACAYMTRDEKGRAKCGIEAAHEAGAIEYKKPISCHLYPVRVKSVPEVEFEALNYDRWDICSAACTLGASLQVPVYQFVKDALIRKYGEDWYQELEAAAQHLEANQ
jgi:hypothetical protein